jgi:NADH:ubiquinone reductase (H+-translocating)
MENTPKQIVLIGGGYASIWAYRSIVEELLIEMIEGQVRVKLICPEDFHFFHGWTAESITGILRDESRMTALSEIFKYAEIIKGSAVQIDSLSRIIYVKTNGGSFMEVRYDQLLLGMGSADRMDIPGLAEYAYTLKSPEGYQRTKMRIQFLLNQASVSNACEAGKTLHFVIAGGGFTGIEIAATLAELINSYKIKYPALRDIRPSILLIHSHREILPQLQKSLDRLRTYTEKTLQQYGIEIRNQTKITRITGKGVCLSDGSSIETRMVISTIGQSRVFMKGIQNMERDPEKRILTNSYLQVKNHPEIWGAGDAVHVVHSVTRNACPSNALWAIKQGQHAGKNIARSIVSHQIRPFNYKGLGQCASLGIGKGIGELYGVPVTGILAWITRWFFFQHFMPSKKVMYYEIKDWIRFFISGRRNEFMKQKKNASGSQVYKTPHTNDLNQLVYQN